MTPTEAGCADRTDCDRRCSGVLSERDYASQYSESAQVSIIVQPGTALGYSVSVRHSSPLAQEAKSSRTAEWPSGTLLSLVVLSGDVSTQCPVSFKGPRSSCQLVFHQCNGGPILCGLSSREGIVHLRRGLHPLRYHGVHALRYHLRARRGRSSGQMRATTELIGLARRIPSTRSTARSAF